jgi:hypothetical protein
MLKKVLYQYMIRHTNINKFKIGELVFLKSNPEHGMLVRSLNIRNNKVEVLILVSGEIYSFVPEVLLQYKYSGLLILNDDYFISLN